MVLVMPNVVTCVILQRVLECGNDHAHAHAHAHWETRILDPASPPQRGACSVLPVPMPIHIEVNAVPGSVMEPDARVEMVVCGVGFQLRGVIPMPKPMGQALVAMLCGHGDPKLQVPIVGGGMMSW